MRADYKTRYKQIGDKPLDKAVTGVRLPVQIGEAIRSLPPEKRSEWLRKVISDAVEKELINKSA